MKIDLSYRRNADLYSSIMGKPTKSTNIGASTEAASSIGPRLHTGTTTAQGPNPHQSLSIRTRNATGVGIAVGPLSP